MTAASSLPMFGAALAGATAAPTARTGAGASATGGTDFARVAADLAAALQMGGAAPATAAGVDPTVPSSASLPAAAMNPVLSTAGTSPLAANATTRHATPIDARLDPHLVVGTDAAALDPALATLPVDPVALLQPGADIEAAPTSPDDALSQQMFALLSGLAPPTTPAELTPATAAADLLAGARATPTLPAQALPLTPATTDAAVGADAGAIDLSSLLSELPAMPRPAETARVAMPLAAAAGAQIAAVALQDVDRDESAAIDGLDALPPGTPLAVHGSIRGPNLPVVPSPLQMPSLADAGFDDELGARMAWVAEQKLGHAEIRLNPEHLGRIDLKIQLEGTRVSAEFNSANADVRQALEATLPRLREMLGQHGLQLGQADVGQRQQNAPQSQGQSAPVSGSVGGDEGASANVAASTPAQVVRNRGLLDEYA